MGGMRKRRNPGIEGDTSSLPCEIIYRILLKLPVKSLLQFRCVCKSWRDTISEPQFRRSHLNESVKLDRQRIFHYWSVPRTNSKYFYSVDYESGDGLEEKVCFTYKKYRRARVKCSCNGLVLLSLKKDYMCVLWNPSTREYKKFSCPPHIHPNYVPGGLCYDSFMDDYKVLFFYKKLFVVFSFRGQCWTEAKEFPYSKFVGDSVIANGVLHLVALKPLGNSTPARSPRDLLFYEYVIVYFDIVDEKFKEMPSPNCIHEVDEFGLTVMDGCLSLYFSTIDRKYVEVWTMKKYGEHDSWTKFIVIPHWLETRHVLHLTPLCVTKKGEIVMILDKVRIVSYNPKDNSCRSLGRTELRNSDVVLYVDSFALPIRTPRVRKKEL